MPGEAAFEDVREPLMESLTQEYKDNAYSAQIETWVTEANVTIDNGKL